MKETGIATSIFDAMLQDADSRISKKTDAQFSPPSQCAML